MRIDRGSLAATGFAAVMLAGLLAPAASAAVPLGGGSSIVVSDDYCTLATIGHDSSGELVGFTASRCGEPGAQVAVEGSEDRGIVGTVAVSNADLHYSVITFSPNKITPTAEFAGFMISGFGDAPGSIQPVCTQGGATGFNCGFTTVADVRPGYIAAMLPAWQPGDDGEPVTVDGRLIGLVYRGFVFTIPGTVYFPGGNAKISVTLFSSILDDVNANGGPGAGFTPIGS